MSEFLDTLKVRMADAQKRLQDAQQKLQHAQQEHQQAMQEFSSWQNAVSVETRREQEAIPLLTVSSTRIEQMTSEAGHTQTTSQQPDPQVGSPSVNKTQIVREVLQQHPNGATPAQIWQEVKDRGVPRVYVYSVLKRLKDGKQASERRGKYYPIIVAKLEEEQQRSLIVQ